MAFYRLEPWGSHYDDLRAGAVASMVANANRNTELKPELFGELDFIPWNEHHRLEAEKAAAAEAALLADREAHSQLLDAVMFPWRK